MRRRDCARHSAPSWAGYTLPSRLSGKPVITSIETRSSWIVATVSVVLLSLSFGALWITAVGVKAIAADLGGARSAPSLASSLAWLGSSIGGVMMGRIADRSGIRLTVIVGAVSICIGLAISALGEPWQLYVGHGLFMGVFGNAGLNAPLYVYVSRWFDRRRGAGADFKRRLCRRHGMAAGVRTCHRPFRLAADHDRLRAVCGRDHRPARAHLPAAAARDRTRRPRRRRRNRHAKGVRLAAEPGIRAARGGGLPVLRDHVDAAGASSRVLHRPRHFRDPWRRDVVATARRRFPQPPGLGRDLGPQWRVADAAPEFGAAGRCHGGVCGDAGGEPGVCRFPRVLAPPPPAASA